MMARSVLEIKLSILEVVRSGGGKTKVNEIIMKANIGYVSLKPKLEELASLGLIERNMEAIYACKYGVASPLRITGRGVEALELGDKLRLAMGER